MTDRTQRPLPSDDQVRAAAGILTRLSECEALHGWVATYRRSDLTHTGVWPEDYDYGSLDEINVRVPDFWVDSVDAQRSWNMQVRRGELLIRQGVEQLDLECVILEEAVRERRAEKAAA